MGRELIGEPGRLDAVVASLGGLPRADVQRAIAAGLVLVEGRPRAKSFRLAGGERITVGDLEAPPLAGEGPAVPIRYEDDALLIVSKPPGVLTHPTARQRTGTLVNRLLGMGVPLAPAGGELRPGIVHRLDAGTSGLIVVAKTDEAYRGLRSMLGGHAADRRYFALVRGSPAHDRFRVEAPLGRRAARIRVDRVEGRPAESSFVVRERLGRRSLLEAAPQTGRTHQIRVHLSAIGHPIVGDRAYGGAGPESRELGLARPFLHSASLAFDHPITGRRVTVDDPLPRDLAEALERARREQQP